jgi:uncharacterized membrane protein
MEAADSSETLVNIRISDATTQKIVIFTVTALKTSNVIYFLACFPYFGKIKAGLCNHMLSVCLILAPEPISTAYFINPSHQYMYACRSPYRC